MPVDRGNASQNLGGAFPPVDFVDCLQMEKAMEAISFGTRFALVTLRSIRNLRGVAPSAAIRHSGRHGRDEQGDRRT